MKLFSSTNISLTIFHFLFFFFYLNQITDRVLKPVKNLIFVSGQRGSPKLVVHGYSFVRNKGNYNTTYWRCSSTRSKGCKAKVVTNRANNKICITHAGHNHPPDYSQFMDN